jgi:hypothetical protein
MKTKVLFIGWIIFFIALFLYSFTQIDLSLTFSSVSIWQGIEKSFQYIGYFNRPLSTYLYTGILIIFSLLYFWTLWLTHTKKLSRKYLWAIILIGTAILFASYNTFSYDLFNYIFDAKIITHYHQSPYLHKALDFSGDPMLTFMHWTDRVYPYGPAWLGLTVPLSFFGANIFIVTFYFFKLLMAGSFLLSAWLIEKICQKTKTTESLFALAFFALNPLVMIESLVSAHNDIVMMCFSLLAIYLVVRQKYIWSILSLAFSVAIKFATAIIVPFYLVGLFYVLKKKSIPWEKLFIGMSVVMIGGVYLASVRTNFQPWYLLYCMPFAALVSKKYFVFIPAVICSILSLITYVPFLYLGNWDKPVPQFLTNLHIVFIVVSILAVVSMFFIKKFKGVQTEKKK